MTVCAQTGAEIHRRDTETPEVFEVGGERTLACRACGHELGRTSARALMVNGVVLVQATVLVCSSCGKRRHWTPLGD